MTRKRVSILIVLLIVLIALVAAAVILANAGKDTKTSKLISDVHFNNVVAMSVSDGQNSVSLKLKDDEWYVEGTDMKIDQIKAASMSTHLCYVYADDTIEEGTNDLSVYGLDPARVTAKITTKDGTVYTFYYGGPTIDNAGVFMRKEGDEHVYTVINDHFKQIASSLTQLTNLDASDIGEELTNVSFKGQYGLVTFEKREESIFAVPWQMTAPMVAPLSSYVMDTISQTVSGLRLEEYLGADYKEEYGISEDSYWFECTDNHNNRLKITFGNDQNEYYSYCQVEGKEGFFTISKAMFEFLDFKVSDFVDSHMISAPITGAKVTDEATTYEINKADTDLLQALLDIHIAGTVEEQPDDSPAYTLALSLDRTSSHVQIKLYDYRKSFYAIDYGDGPYVYIFASEWDSLMTQLKEAGTP